MLKLDLSYKGKDAVHHYEGEAENASEDWLKEIYSFLLDWHNGKDDIQLKTSGSTGVPKIMSIKKSTMIFSALQTIDYFQLKKGNNFLLCIPAEYIGGKMMLLRALLCEADIYAIPPKLNLKLPDVNIDFAAMIPIQAENYLKNSNHFIDKIIIGGASISNQLENRIRLNTFTKFWSTYGMTETVSHVALRKLNGLNEAQYYTPLKNVLIGTDERGCLTIYNKNYNENVIVTNDLVEFDSENNFRVIGRIDNVINSGGLKIIPEILEEEINGLIDRRNLLIGLEDEMLGQKLILLIEGEKLDETSLDLLKNTLREKFKSKSPKDIYFIDKFVETENGKVNRKATKKLL